MADKAGHMSLGRIVMDYIDRSGQTTAQYRRLFSIAVNGLRELNLDVSGNIKSCRVKVLENKTVELPEDYIQWVKVGVLNERGEVATLDYNKNLTSVAGCDLNRVSENVDESNIAMPAIPYPFWTFLNYYGDGYYGVNLFGIAGTEFTKLGGFKVDDKKGIILLSNDFKFDYIILEYLARIEMDDEYQVPDQLYEALIAWMGWMDVFYKPPGRKISIYDKDDKRKHWIIQKIKAKDRMNPFRLEMANQYTRETIKLVPRS